MAKPSFKNQISQKLPYYEIGLLERPIGTIHSNDGSNPPPNVQGCPDLQMGWVYGWWNNPALGADPPGSYNPDWWQWDGFIWPWYDNCDESTYGTFQGGTSCVQVMDCDSHGHDGGAGGSAAEMHQEMCELGCWNCVWCDMLSECISWDMMGGNYCCDEQGNCQEGDYQESAGQAEGEEDVADSWAGSYDLNVGFGTSRSSHTKTVWCDCCNGKQYPGTNSGVPCGDGYPVEIQDVCFLTCGSNHDAMCGGGCGTPPGHWPPRGEEYTYTNLDFCSELNNTPYSSSSADNFCCCFNEKSDCGCMTANECSANGGSNQGEYSDYCKNHLKLPYCNCTMEEISDSISYGTQVAYCDVGQYPAGSFGPCVISSSGVGLWKWADGLTDGVSRGRAHGVCKATDAGCGACMSTLDGRCEHITAPNTEHGCRGDNWIAGKNCNCCNPLAGTCSNEIWDEANLTCIENCDAGDSCSAAHPNRKEGSAGSCICDGCGIDFNNDLEPVSPPERKPLLVSGGDRRCPGDVDWQPVNCMNYQGDVFCDGLGPGAGGWWGCQTMDLPSADGCCYCVRPDWGCDPSNPCPDCASGNFDCAGVCNGSAELDMCGVCNGNNECIAWLWTSNGNQDCATYCESQGKVCIGDYWTAAGVGSNCGETCPAGNWCSDGYRGFSGILGEIGCNNRVGDSYNCRNYWCAAVDYWDVDDPLFNGLWGDHNSGEECENFPILGGNQCPFQHTGACIDKGDWSVPSCKNYSNTLAPAASCSSPMDTQGSVDKFCCCGDASIPMICDGTLRGGGQKKIRIPDGHTDNVNVAAATTSPATLLPHSSKPNIPPGEEYSYMDVDFCNEIISDVGAKTCCCFRNGTDCGCMTGGNCVNEGGEDMGNDSTYCATHLQRPICNCHSTDMNSGLHRLNWSAYCDVGNYPAGGFGPCVVGGDSGYTANRGLWMWSYDLGGDEGRGAGECRAGDAGCGACIGTVPGSEQCGHFTAPGSSGGCRGEVWIEGANCNCCNWSEGTCAVNWIENDGICIEGCDNGDSCPNGTKFWDSGVDWCGDPPCGYCICDECGADYSGYISGSPPIRGPLDGKCPGDDNWQMPNCRNYYPYPPMDVCSMQAYSGGGLWGCDVVDVGGGELYCWCVHPEWGCDPSNPQIAADSNCCPAIQGAGGNPTACNENSQCGWYTPFGCLSEGCAFDNPGCPESCIDCASGGDCSNCEDPTCNRSSGRSSGIGQTQTVKDLTVPVDAFTATTKTMTRTGKGRTISRRSPLPEGLSSRGRRTSKVKRTPNSGFNPKRRTTPVQSDMTRDEWRGTTPKQQVGDSRKCSSNQVLSADGKCINV